MTATLHKLSAGDGYTYLTRQVAVGDSTERGYSSLGDYYSMKGEAPGVWVGGGLPNLGTAGEVSEAQMLNLFGQGLHPDAEKVRAAALVGGASVKAADAATLLGQQFRQFEPNQLWRERLADAYAAFNTVHGNAVNTPIPQEQRDRIRTDVARTLYTETYGRDPGSERELTSFVAQASRPDRTAVAGYDVTFSPVKSVSTLWAIAPREISEQVEAVHAAAVADTVKWLERNATYTRSGTNGVAQIDVHGLITAQFTHRDSRAGDPDLHTHVAISNKVQALDGRWLSLDGRMIHRYLVAASEHYNTRLEAEIIDRVGGQFAEWETVPGKRPIRELDSVDPALNDRFSSRRQAITDHRAELVEGFRTAHGRLPTTVEMIALSQQANLATRDAKHEPRSLAEQRELWHAQAVEVLGSQAALDAMLVNVAAEQTLAPVELTPGKVADIAANTIRVVEASRAQWSRHNILAEAQRQLRYTGHAVGTATDELAQQVTTVALGPENSIPIGMDAEPDGVEAPAELTRLDGTSVYRMAGGQLHTSAVILDAEQAVVTAAGTGGARTVTTGTVQLGMLEWSANNGGRTLNSSQTAMVTEVATSDRHLMLALAPAGTGKTTTMGALATVWQATGGTIVALAPQASAARELAAQIPGVSSDTVDKLVYDLSGQPASNPARWTAEVTRNTLLIVDEAGLGSTINLAAVTRFAQKQGARVLLVGDDRQRAAAGAGGVLRDIDAAHGTVSLDEVLRFRDPRQGAASLAMRAGDPGAAGYYVDAGLLHTVTPDQAAERVFDAWHADQLAGIASIMIAPSLTQVTELNLRARTARLVGRAVGAELGLPNGEAVSAGDVIVTKKNDRRLSLGGTDFVRNNHRWAVQQVNPDGSIIATEVTRGITRTLPASYIQAGHVRLGYAATTASVQGLTVEGNAYALLDPEMTRNDLYPAMTRAKGDNHGYLTLGGVGDIHEVITPDAVRPQAAAELFAAIIERDGGDRSALTEIREAADPHLRLTLAAGAYAHAILTGVEALIGPERLTQITADAETAVPGATSSPAWDTLRGHLATISMQGGEPHVTLDNAAGSRELGTARDLSAVLDWRMDHSGNHCLGAGPLPWLPAIPPQLAQTPAWGDYLAARGGLVDELVAAIRAEVGGWTTATATAPAWAVPYLSSRSLTEGLALWRASTGVPAADLRPAGDRPQRIAHQRYHRQFTRDAAVVAGDPADGSGRWQTLLTAAGITDIAADPYWPVLVARLTAADTAGAPVAQLVTNALTEKALPSEARAAVLWARIAPHLGNLHLTAGGSHQLRPAWTADLTTVLGQEHTERIVADRLWPAIVINIDAAARTGADPSALIRSAASVLAVNVETAPAHQHPAMLLADILRITDPAPVEPDTEPADPEDAELHASADAHTAEPAAGHATRAAVATADRMVPGDAGDVPLPEEPVDPEQVAVPDRQAEPARPDTDDAATQAVDTGRLLQVVAAANSFYRAQTTDSWVPDYLTGRGLGTLTPRTGYAPDSWTAVVDHLHENGYTDRELLAAGLARTSSRSTLIDAFRDRVMLPIHNTDGEVVAFTGRRNPDRVDDYNPKYLNSPTTAVYTKSDLPYGLHPRAIDALRAGADLAIAEGPLDAEAINLAGDGRIVAIAPLGTALTAGQVTTVDQVAPLTGRRVLTAMDTDQAGQAAAVRAFAHLRAAGVDNTLTVTLPAGRKDPAETLALDGVDQLAANIQHDTHPLADLVVDDILSRWPAPTTPEYRILALDEVAPMVATLPADQREHQISRIAAHLTLDSVTVTDTVIAHLPAPLPASPLGLPQPPVLISDQPRPRPNVMAALARAQDAVSRSTQPTTTADPMRRRGSNGDDPAPQHEHQERELDL